MKILITNTLDFFKAQFTINSCYSSILIIETGLFTVLPLSGGSSQLNSWRTEPNVQEPGDGLHVHVPDVPDLSRLVKCPHLVAVKNIKLINYTTVYIIYRLIYQPNVRYLTSSSKSLISPCRYRGGKGLSTESRL